MVEVLYCLEYRFMCKTFAAVHRHVDVEGGYLPLRPDVADCWGALPEVSPADWTSDAIDAAVADADPDVVVANSRYRPEELSFRGEYPLVHVRHGSSVGRGEPETVADLDGVVDVALAPGEYWQTRYDEVLSDDVRTPVVGVPEADALVGTDPPDERRVLYAPTNHNYGGGCYLETAEHVLGVVAESLSDFGTAAHPTYELRFRPHPHDRTEEPGKSVTERCADRIADLPNVEFDDTAPPKESMLESDLLISDYSGIVTEWLHTGRPLVQLTAVAADAAVPQLGYTARRLSLDLLDQIYADGYPEDVARTVEEKRSELGIPMDGRAGERAAREVMACTQ